MEELRTGSGGCKHTVAVMLAPRWTELQMQTLQGESFKLTSAP